MHKLFGEGMIVPEGLTLPFSGLEQSSNLECTLFEVIFTNLKKIP